jgi:DNA-binding response OmpR family regulator
VESAPTVLIVDDDPEIRDALSDFLEAAGYRVETAADGTEALAVLGQRPVACILLDVMMPGPSGFEVARHIRASTDVPILFLSARDTDMDKLRGLGLGDDYIVKSASAAEVVARVKAVLRRAQPRLGPAQHELWRFGRLVVDPRAHEVHVDGQPTTLTAREFELLRVLVEHPRQVFTHDQLVERIWGAYGDRHTVTVCIGRLREKIERDPARPEYLITVRGVGYRFEGRRQ